jgi:pantoate--beta-alanine ligase
MQTITEIDTLRAVLAEARRSGQAVGLVPTMGAFHEGHLTLMRQARAENDFVVVTLFVNPTQFNDPADFARYPRDVARDGAMAASAGVDLLFQPTPDQIYPSGFDTVVTVPGLSERLEGASRPGHFAGVATVVVKLLNLAGANRAYFGEKDWQQLQVIRRLTQDLNIPTEIVPVPTVREPDGLAMSSRNVRLSAEQRAAACVISRALSDTQALADAGETDAAALSARLMQTLQTEPLVQVDYAVVVHPETLQPIQITSDGALAAVAALLGPIRLIDNRLLRPATAIANADTTPHARLEAARGNAK